MLVSGSLLPLLPLLPPPPSAGKAEESALAASWESAEELAAALARAALLPAAEGEPCRVKELLAST